MPGLWHQQSEKHVQWCTCRNDITWKRHLHGSNVLSFGHGDDAPNVCVQWTSQESVALRPLQCDARHAWTFPQSQRRLQRSSRKYDGIVYNHSADVAQRVDAFLSQPPVYHVPLVSKTWSSCQQREAPVRLWYANMRGNPPTSCPRIRRGSRHGDIFRVEVLRGKTLAAKGLDVAEIF